MENIPTSDDMLSTANTVCNSQHDTYTWWDVQNLMIDFAKKHVEAASEAAEQAYRENTNEEHFDDQTRYNILHAYPLTNIK